MFTIFGKLFRKSDGIEDGDNELWVMIQENSFFRDNSHLAIVDELAEIIENKKLGEFDGHSSGAYQLEINFLEVRNYNKVKGIIIDYFAAKYPGLEYTISQGYETIYEKLECVD